MTDRSVTHDTLGLERTSRPPAAHLFRARPQPTGHRGALGGVTPGLALVGGVEVVAVDVRRDIGAVGTEVGQGREHRGRRPLSFDPELDARHLAH